MSFQKIGELVQVGELFTGSGKEITIEDLEPASTYEIRLQAQNKKGMGVESLALSVDTPPDVPDQIQNLRVTDYSDFTVSLEWDVPANDYGAKVTGYTIVWEKFNSQTELVELKENVDLSDTSYTFTRDVDGIKPEIEYRFKVQAVNS